MENAEVSNNAEVSGATDVEVVVTVNQQDISLTGDQLGVNMDTPDNQVLTAVRSAVQEHIEDGDGNFTFAVRRALNTNKIYVYPKSTFG